MAIPQPLPHANEDPDNLAARASKQTFTDQAQQVRSNPNLSGRAKAEQVTALYDTHVQETAQAYERLTNRRRARLEYLEGLVPVGTGIPADANPADRAVLMTAFRAAWDQANDTDRAGRKRLLAEAERFDDGAMRRAVLTSALDNGEMDTIRDWTALHADQKGYLDEVGQLRDAFAGGGPNRGFDQQDFTPLPKPSESYEWQLIADTPHAQPGDNGRIVRPGIIEFDRQRRR
ncbi:hypothetical protein ACFVIL_29265 [Streptomyces sp. NPDC127159]|uniref:hypothetical protein n=1 Tax=unclassified Streptomyces TaxID=2593676 RepID=UPI003632D2C1